MMAPPLGTLAALAALACFASPVGAPTQPVSIVGDPGMRGPLRVILEGWNVCDRAGDTEGAAPRWADCVGADGKQRITPAANDLAPPIPIPGAAAAPADMDAYTEAKERYLGDVCRSAAPHKDMASFWAFEMMNCNEQKGDPSLAACGNRTHGRRRHPRRRGLGAGLGSGAGHGPMNQPREVWHNATAARADGSVGGSFSGTYDNFTGPAASSFVVDWSRNSSAESWVFAVSLRISQSYNDIVLYFAINNDGPGGYGGYDWEGRGMMLRPTSADSILLRATLQVNEWRMSCKPSKGKPSCGMFYLPQWSGCWKLDGRLCNGDLTTDITRYAVLTIDEESRLCRPDNILNCPPTHTRSDGTVVRREDPAFPHACYINFCSAHGEANTTTCNPLSAPDAQEILAMQPCKEWAAYGAPTATIDLRSWSGKKSFEIDVGAMGRGLYFSGRDPAPRRQWLGWQIGAEPGGAAMPGAEIAWSISDVDLLEG